VSIASRLETSTGERYARRPGVAIPSMSLVKLGGGNPALLKETLTSAVTMAVVASLWPLIIVFEGGHGLVTRYAGVDILAEVLS
jgi:hypothetical protein